MRDFTRIQEEFAVRRIMREPAQMDERGRKEKVMRKKAGAKSKKDKSKEINMAQFTGQLSIIGHQSNLDDGQTDWLLLMAGLSDPAMATFAATQFLVKTKKLHSGQSITVLGESGAIGSVSVISMSDASAA
jgi:hypothetical protein